MVTTTSNPNLYGCFLISSSKTLKEFYCAVYEINHTKVVDEYIHTYNVTRVGTYLYVGKDTLLG